MIGSRQTYLYFEGTPLFPFGHGLSYASFEYGNLVAHVGENSVHVTFTVTNTGSTPADEVAQLYSRAVTPSVSAPAANCWPTDGSTYSPAPPPS